MYSDTPENANFVPCVPCPTGYSTWGAGRPTKEDCSKCAPGFGAPPDYVINITPPSACTLCAKGWYSSQGVSPCAPCPVGTTTTNNGSSHSSNCTGDELLAARPHRFDSFALAVPPLLFCPAPWLRFAARGQQATYRAALLDVRCSSEVRYVCVRPPACLASSPSGGSSPAAPRVTYLLTRPTAARRGTLLSHTPAVCLPGYMQCRPAPVCEPGYGVDSINGTCEPCRIGRFSPGGTAAAPIPICRGCGIPWSTGYTKSTSVANCTCA